MDDFASISGLLTLKEFPIPGTMKILSSRGWKTFSICLGKKRGKHLFRFTSMHCGKGVVGLASRAKAFWGWLQGKGWEDDFASISGLLHQTGNS